MEKDIEKLEAENAQLREELEKAESVIEDLKQELAKALEARASEQTSQIPQVKIGKDVYNIVIPTFIYGGEKRTAKDVQQDKKLAAALLKEGSAVLEKINFTEKNTNK